MVRYRPDTEPQCDPVKDEILLSDHPRLQFGWRDRGEHVCYVDKGAGAELARVELSLDHRYRSIVYHWSLVNGLITAFGFQALTLPGKLVHHLLWNFGCRFCTIWQDHHQA